ncbi:MAG: hypothetical protein MUO82_04205, partial [Candidatus Thermoplasmatota archaeon]|nr:hypothetical protein [Candidatus Thermoplasmatota archaeon]
MDYIFNKFRQYMLSMLFGWISFWIGFSIGHDIVWLMNGTSVESITTGIISGLISGLIVSYITYRVLKQSEVKKIHRREIVFEGINKEFPNLNIAFDTQNFKVLMIDLEELEKKKIYKYTLQHLNAYQLILDSWNKSNELIKKINGEIDDFVKFVFNKIETEIDENHKIGLSHPIHLIIEQAIRNDFKKFSIKTRDSKADIEISL